MEILNSDCVEEILSYLPLSDLFNLRVVSRRFKQEVENSLPRVRSLPLFLTTPRTPEEVAAYEYVIDRYVDLRYSNKLSSSPYICRLSFGTSGTPTLEDGTILRNQNHIRRADFLIINSILELKNCIKFMQKHCPNINNLALVFDHFRNYKQEVVNVLEAFPALKVLLMESTYQDSCRYGSCQNLTSHPLTRQSNWHYLWRSWRNYVKLLPEEYDSILALDNLEELYLFPRRHSNFIYDSYHSESPDFGELILRRLRVFHSNSQLYFTKIFHRLFDLPTSEMLDNYGQLEELSSGQIEWPAVNRNPPIFTSLTKYIINCGFPYSLQHVFRAPVLKFLDVARVFFEEAAMEIINSFPVLERFHCLNLELGDWTSRQEDIVGEEMKNRTIKHLQLTMYKGFTSNIAEESKRLVRYLRKHFLALEICVFLEPEYSEIRVSDLSN